ncbi:uncharacterized protein UDID_11697 [Ustilago sp. UG-2017a]|nr:uncharacterized protein UDID_11697 [Ustilago sp. UG-2017a]
MAEKEGPSSASRDRLNLVMFRAIESRRDCDFLRKALSTNTTKAAPWLSNLDLCSLGWLSLLLSFRKFTSADRHRRPASAF